MEQQRKARVIRTTDNRAPRGIRRLGQALIALAQAQAEAEAQAQAEATTSINLSTEPDAGADAQPNDAASRPTGDAA